MKFEIFSHMTVDDLKGEGVFVQPADEPDKMAVGLYRRKQEVFCRRQEGIVCSTVAEINEMLIGAGLKLESCEVEEQKYSAFRIPIGFDMKPIYEKMEELNTLA
jgi:hypothetical protein